MEDSMKTNHKDAAVQALLDAGFKAAGQTPTETVKFMVNAGYGYPSFKGATFGGRDRFVHPTTGHRATVGKVTTNFYQVANGATFDFVSRKTKDLEGIREELIRRLAKILLDRTAPVA
jgi:hypothetical protein